MPAREAPVLAWSRPAGTSAGAVVPRPGTVAAMCTRVADGLSGSRVVALVSAWAALAVAGSFGLPMLLVWSGHRVARERRPGRAGPSAGPPLAPGAPVLEQRARDWHPGRNHQRAIGPPPAIPAPGRAHCRPAFSSRPVA